MYDIWICQHGSTWSIPRNNRLNEVCFMISVDQPSDFGVQYVQTSPFGQVLHTYFWVCEGIRTTQCSKLSPISLLGIIAGNRRKVGSACQVVKSFQKSVSQRNRGSLGTFLSSCFNAPLGSVLRSRSSSCILAKASALSSPTQAISIGNKTSYGKKICRRIHWSLLGLIRARREVKWKHTVSTWPFVKNSCLEV
jgi:hypothetical protein